MCYEGLVKGFLEIVEMQLAKPEPAHQVEVLYVGHLCNCYTFHCCYRSIIIYKLVLGILC